MAIVEAAAVSVGQNTQLMAKEGTVGTVSIEAREPTQHPWELEPNGLVIP